MMMEPLIASYSAGSGTSVDYSEQDIIIMKLDAGGSILWSNRYRNTVDADDIDALSFSHEGNILVNGRIQGIGAGEADGFVLSVNQDGIQEKGDSLW